MASNVILAGNVCVLTRTGTGMAYHAVGSVTENDEIKTNGVALLGQQILVQQPSGHRFTTTTQSVRSTIENISGYGALHIGLQHVRPLFVHSVIFTRSVVTVASFLRTIV